MKKLLQVLVIHGIIMLMGFTQFVNHEAKAQIQLEDPTWQVLAGDVDWLETSGNETRGIAFNPESGNVLVATRADGAAIQLIDGEDGSEVGQLDMTGVEGGFFPINRVGVTEDGQIFVANFSLNGPDFRIYHWEDEQAEPERIFDGDPLGDRIGDGFGVAGAGDDVYIYASGTFQDEIAEFSWDGQELTGPELIDLPGADHANASIVGVPDEEALWVNGRDASILKISREDGEVLAEIGNDIIADGNGELDLIELDGRTILATGIMEAEDNRFSLIDVTEESAPLLLAQTPDLTRNANDFRVGGVAFDQENETLTVLATHSSISQFSVDADQLITDQLLGNYYIPQGDNARGYDTLKEALDSLNSTGAAGGVTFLIDDDLNEAEETHRIDREDLTEDTPVNIRSTAEGHTLQTSEFQIVDTGYLTIDGEVDAGTLPGLTIEKHGDEGGAIALLSETREVSIRNIAVTYAEDFGADSYAILINRQEDDVETGRSINLDISNTSVGTDEAPFRDAVWMFGSPTNDTYWHENVTYSDNTFYVSRSALRTQTHINTVFEGNQVFMYSNEGAQGLNLNTPIDSFTMRNNEFEMVTGDVQESAMFVGLNITNTLVDADIYNNTFAINYDGDGSDHSFYGIRHVGVATSGTLNLYHNTIRVGDTGQSGIHAVLGSSEEASDVVTLNLINNIMVNERDAENSYIYDWNSGNIEAEYNNLFNEGQGAVARLGDEVYETLPEWQEATGEEDNSVSVPVEFVSESDLRLTGASVGDVSLAGTPLDAVTVDIDGNERDAENPYMGASEGDERLVPDPGVQAFDLLLPESGADFDLEVEDQVEFSWELPKSNVAWARRGGRFLDDNFGHAGDGETGPGKYIGTEMDEEDAALITPLLVNPGELSFWISAHSNSTSLDLVIEYADYDSRLDDEWEELETFSTDGGSGDFSTGWTHLEAEVDAVGEYYLRFRQVGDVSEAFYIDDVDVTTSTETADMALAEDFEQFDSFPSLQFNWHLDEGGDFSDPAFSHEADSDGGSLSLTFSSGELSGILSDLGVEEGETFNGMWTVTVEIGEWETAANEPFNISMVSGEDVSADPGEQPYEFTLDQNYPNPFNASTTIEYTLPEQADVTLEVYNINGQRVKTLVEDTQDRGRHTVNFDASGMASGVYIYRIHAGDHMKVKQMTLVK